jgi:hypothetical protein
MCAMSHIKTYREGHKGRADLSPSGREIPVCDIASIQSAQVEQATVLQTEALEVEQAIDALTICERVVRRRQNFGRATVVLEANAGLICHRPALNPGYGTSTCSRRSVHQRQQYSSRRRSDSSRSSLVWWCRCASGFRSIPKPGSSRVLQQLSRRSDHVRNIKEGTVRCRSALHSCEKSLATCR